MSDLFNTNALGLQTMVGTLLERKTPSNLQENVAFLLECMYKKLGGAIQRNKELITKYNKK